jgi:hypothetical protein
MDELSPAILKGNMAKYEQSMAILVRAPESAAECPGGVRWEEQSSLSVATVWSFAYCCLNKSNITACRFQVTLYILDLSNPKLGDWVQISQPKILRLISPAESLHRRLPDAQQGCDYPFYVTALWRQ